MIGGAALLADGILTPAVTVTTAIEGLRTIPEMGPRAFGRRPDQRDHHHHHHYLRSCLPCSAPAPRQIGKLFGPLMTLWFLFLARRRPVQRCSPQRWSILRALNPIRGIHVPVLAPSTTAGIMVLGFVLPRRRPAPRRSTRTWAMSARANIYAILAVREGMPSS